MKQFAKINVLILFAVLFVASSVWAQVPSVSWNESSPAGTDPKSQGDNRIREMKTQIREVIDVDHQFNSSGSDADNGYHNQVTLIEAADIGTGAEGRPILGAQTISGKAELVYTDEDDNDVQITNNGEIQASSIGDYPNDTYIKSVDFVGTGTVDLIKGSTNDEAVVPDGSELASSAAPTEDEDISNKKYVDDQVGTIDVSTFGTWASRSSATSYLAASDGMVCAALQYTSGSGVTRQIIGYTDSSNPPVTIRVTDTAGKISSVEQHGGFCMPVKNGDYYRVTQTDLDGSGSYTFSMHWLDLD